jgi:hypothetical protein
MNYVQDWSTWVDWQGFGFSKKEKIKPIHLSQETLPYDLGFCAFPPNYVDQCNLIFVIDNKKRSRVWFWNPERFFRFAEFDNEWVPQTPCSAGSSLSANVLDCFIQKKLKDYDFDQPCWLVSSIKDLPSHLQDIFNVTH